MIAASAFSAPTPDSRQGRPLYSSGYTWFLISHLTCCYGPQPRQSAGSCSGSRFQPDDYIRSGAGAVHGDHYTGTVIDYRPLLDAVMHLPAWQGRLVRALARIGPSPVDWRPSPVDEDPPIADWDIWQRHANELRYRDVPQLRAAIWGVCCQLARELTRGS